MAQLEVRRYNGTTFYKLEGDDYQLALKWKAIDCGCAAYASARAILWPEMLKMIERLAPTPASISPSEEKIKVIA